MRRPDPIGLILLTSSLACNEGEPMITTVPIAAVDHDALYVANGADDTISVIDAIEEEKIGDIRIEGASHPHHVYASPDGARLAVALPGIDPRSGGSRHSDVLPAIAVLEASTGAVVAARVLDAPGRNAIFAPDGGELWAASSRRPGEIAILDPETLDEITTIPVAENPGEITFSPGGDFAFVAHPESGIVSVIDPGENEVIDELEVGGGPAGAWPGRDGAMYAVSRDAQRITAIDGATHQVIRTYALDFTPSFATVAPNGELWVTDEDRGRVVFFRAGSDQIAGELSTGQGARAIAFSDDGTRAYVTNGRSSTVSIVDVDRKAVVASVPVGRGPNGVLFRPF